MSDEELRKRLLNEDEASSLARAGGPSSETERKAIADMATLAKVRAERSKRRMIGAWLLTLALLIGGTVAEAVLRSGAATAPGGGTRSPALTAIAVATRVAFIVAMASTVAYIIRSRGATLAEMNRRLARLEELVEGMARAKRD